MQITPHIHLLPIPFSVQLPTGPVSRSVNAVLLCGESLALVDSGVAGAQKRIFDYLQSMGRAPAEIETLVLTHSHPDHIGAALALKRAAGCTVAAHGAERDWIEDVALQERERPVPGFNRRPAGPLPPGGGAAGAPAGGSQPAGGPVACCLPGVAGPAGARALTHSGCPLGSYPIPSQSALP